MADILTVATDRGEASRLARWRPPFRLIASLARSPARQFHLVSLMVLLGGMLGVGWWLGRQIEGRVMYNTVYFNTLYIESFVSPLLQGLDERRSLASDDLRMIDSVLSQTPLGRHLAAFVIWGQDGRILYSSDPTQVGVRAVPHADLRRALAGSVSWEVVGSHDEPHIPRQDKSVRLLAMYTPVRRVDSSAVIAVAEFYQPFDPIRHDIAMSQWRTWLVIGGATLLMYLLLVGFVQRASNTIVRQETALSDQVAQLTALLHQNGELRDHMQQAAHRAATSNERVLRRISADVHDGPLQVLGAAVLHCDRVCADYEAHPELPGAPHLAIMQRSISQAMHELRAICSDLGLPQINPTSPGALIEHVVKNHELHTGTRVQMTLRDLPDDLIPSVKVSLYRILQEGLSNAAHHGRGVGQRVSVIGAEKRLLVEVADSGPGFDLGAAIDGREHLGLAGMRDRVESLGGQFALHSAPGQGTRLLITLPLTDSSADDW